MAMKKIKKNDAVIVIAGKDKGRTGTLTRIVGDRAYVDGVNMVKKHQKPNPQANIQGGIIEKEAPLHLSNLAILNPTTKKADRVGFRTLNDGTKVRYYKSTDEVIEI
jgi:large subunit ribosomal protein L24